MLFSCIVKIGDRLQWFDRRTDVHTDHATDTLNLY